MLQHPQYELGDTRRSWAMTQVIQILLSVNICLVLKRQVHGKYHRLIKIWVILSYTCDYVFLYMYIVYMPVMNLYNENIWLVNNVYACKYIIVSSV